MHFNFKAYGLEVEPEVDLSRLSAPASGSARATVSAGDRSGQIQFRGVYPGFATQLPADPELRIGQANYVAL